MQSSKRKLGKNQETLSHAQSNVARPSFNSVPSKGNAKSRRLSAYDIPNYTIPFTYSIPYSSTPSASLPYSARDATKSESFSVPKEFNFDCDISQLREKLIQTKKLNFKLKGELQQRSKQITCLFLVIQVIQVGISN